MSKYAPLALIALLILSLQDFLPPDVGSPPELRAQTPASAHAAAENSTARKYLDVSSLSTGDYHLKVAADGSVALVPFTLVVPGVIDPGNPNPPGSTFAKKVENLTDAVNDSETAEKVAVGYRTTARQIKAGTFKTKQQVTDAQRSINELMFRESNVKAAWTDWEAQVNALLEDLQDEGKLNDLDAMEVAWNQVADGVDASTGARVNSAQVTNLIDAVGSGDPAKQGLAVGAISGQFPNEAIDWENLIQLILAIIQIITQLTGG